VQRIIFHSIILLVSTLLLIFFAHTISNDFLQYELIYDQFTDYKINNKGSFKEFMIFHRFEPGFELLYYYLLSFFAANTLFFLIAIPVMTIKYLLFLKYLKFPLAAWFFYIVLFFPSLDSSQLRTSIVSMIIIYILLTKLSNFRYILNIIVAISFHYLGIIILLIRLYKYAIFLILIIVIGSFLFNDILLWLSSPNFKLDYYIVNKSGLTVNYLSTNAAAHLLLSIYCFISWRGFNEAQKKGAFLIILGIVIYYLLGYNPSIAHRIREVSLLGIFPVLFFTRVRFTYASLIAYISLFYMSLYSCFLVINELIDIL
jgi:hypothetical protein